MEGQTSLAKGFVTKATASIKNLQVEKDLAITGQGDIPAKGTLSANANVSGTLEHPDALADLTLAKAVIYTESLNELATKVALHRDRMDVPGLGFDIPAGTLNASANYAPAGPSSCT